MAPVTAQLSAHLPVWVRAVMWTIYGVTRAAYLLGLWRPTISEAEAFVERVVAWASDRIEVRVS